jgi:hypothetical protein
MPIKTDLNVTPYYDDYNEVNNFHQILARPGYAVQARELTQMQSILRNSLEHVSNFVLQEGSVVVPGQVRMSQMAYLRIQPNYAGEAIDITQYVGKEITGVTSGVVGMVAHAIAGTTTESPTFYIRYIKGGTDNTSSVFNDDELLQANASVVNGSTTYAIGDSSARVEKVLSSGQGLTCTIQAGIYYLRGCFVHVAEQTIVVSKYTVVGAGTSVRVGFEIKETVITPETESSLLDNAQGTSNYAAKGAHRLKIEAVLSFLVQGSIEDESFIELFSVENGTPVSPINREKLGSILETMARRTYDESGDYTVRPFMFESLESVTLNENIGVYNKGDVTGSGNIASNSFIALKVSPGKAYIRGNEIEKLTNTFVDIPKARTVSTINSGVTTYDIGNYLNVTNMFGTPDITFISGETTPYKQISLFDQPTVIRGVSAGNRIGVARTRTVEFYSGEPSATTAVFRCYLFDLRPFTQLTLSGTPSPTLESNHASGGVQIKGETSKATGWLFADGTSGENVYLTNVSGGFKDGEKITASDSLEGDQVVETSSNIDITILRSRTNSISETRQLHMVDVDSGQNFSCDVVLDALPTTESYLTLDGTNEFGVDGDSLIISELENIPLGLNRGATGGTGSTLPQAKLKLAEKNIGVFKLPKKGIKTHLTTSNAGQSDTSYYLRKQYVTTSSSVGVITISGGTNEVFASHSNVDYIISILQQGAGGLGQAGDIVSAGTGFSGAGTSTLTIANNDVFGNGAKLKIIATLFKSSASPKTKTAKLMKQLKVAGAETAAYGTRPKDLTISLGRADCFKLVAVLDSESETTDAVAPTMVLGTIIGNFIKGEEITGSLSGAIGRIITTSSPMNFVRKRGTTATFQSGETITGFSSSATAPVLSTTTGGTNITDRYEMDQGQRDNYYDISRIVRKPNVSKPLGRLVVIYDYLEHGTGDFFTVDSYVDVADRMTYEDIPKYSATKVDPDDPAPSGEYDLQDVLDMRPRVEDIAGTSTNVELVDQVTGNSFDFVNRQFDGTGASTVNFMKPGGLITTDFEYYLPYRGRLYIEKTGRIKFKAGTADENPRTPDPVADTMQLATMFVPAYTFKPQDMKVVREKNRRYTMRDIGKIEERLSHVEYYTSLTLLERDAESFQIQDANGLDRFKSGFVVDSFSGHSIGDAKHKDYKCSIDMSKNELRPMCTPKAVALQESIDTDVLRNSANYKRTGDLITLPYEEIVYQEQPYASRVERVTPLLLSTWTGQIDLDPSGDEWFETETAPDLIINVEGNFDTFSRENADAVGTVWGAWSTVWGGSSTASNTTIQGNNEITRTTTTTRGQNSRSGVQTDIIPQIDLESQGTKVIQRAFIPFMRAVNITFEGFGFYPNIRLYCFFDQKNVNQYVTPLSGFTTDAADVSGVPVAATPLISTAAGEIKGILSIPDPKVTGNPKFRTGELEFRLTSSSTDVRTKDPETAGTTTFLAVGILETEQETIIATRNARIVTQSVNQSTSITSQSTQTSTVAFSPAIGCGCGGNDPLAQTFIVSASPRVGETFDVLNTPRSSGRFITSIDLFFSHKDINLPVWVEIHNTENGFPGSKILPFARKVLNPTDINVSSDASVATRFNFPSPVYVMHEKEYALCLMSTTPEYKVFISRMGETDILGSRMISKQPHTGVLFKGHNNRTWAPSMTEDLKFRMNVAKFDTGSVGNVTFQNKNLPVKSLVVNPLKFTSGDTAVQVLHKDHGMYLNTNNVTIDGMVSGAETTLASAMDSAATSLTLTSSTDFDDTSGKFAYDSSSQWWLKIGDEIMKYGDISGTNVSSVTRAQISTGAKSHVAGAKVQLYMLHRVPLHEINKTHESIQNINMDSYTVTLATAPTITGATSIATNGGDQMTATENIIMDTIKPIISNMVLPETDIEATILPMTATSPSGSQSSFVPVGAAGAIPIDFNIDTDFEVPYMIASEINEQKENAANKSVNIEVKLTSNNSDVSPVIDMGRCTLLCISNRLNVIDQASDVYPTSNWNSSLDPIGDDNAAIYLTKKISLENPATAIKVFFAGHRHATSEIELYYKILRSDDASEFDDLSYVPFNGNGSPDQAVNPSSTKQSFTEYLYSAGVTDDGAGQPLDEFISFQIKIVMKGTNTAEPPRIKELRAIALAM